jgi:hypothetical protein
MNNHVAFLAAFSLLLGCAALPAAGGTADYTTGQASAPRMSRYSEDTYEEYENAASGAVTFSVDVVSAGAMKTLAGKALKDLVTVPSYRLVSNQAGTAITNPQFVVPSEERYGLHDLRYFVDQFEDFGLPLNEGTYRRLSVTAAVGGDVRTHQAVEFCWSSLNHCAILDPVVVWLESKVKSRLALAATGWGPRISGHGARTLDAALSTSSRKPSPRGRCGLASHHNWTGETMTWSAYEEKFSDIFGITLATEYLGEQQDEIVCTASCKPETAGFSDSSSASNSDPVYSFACSNKGAGGTTGSSARSIAETACVDNLSFGSVSISYSVEDQGSSSVSVTLHDAGGSVHSNGGVYYDSCGIF